MKFVYEFLLRFVFQGVLIMVSTKSVIVLV